MHRNSGSHAWLEVEMGLVSDWVRQGEFGYDRMWRVLTPMPTETNVQGSRKSKIITDVKYHKGTIKSIGKSML
jgi:hypothetical protein